MGQARIRGTKEQRAAEAVARAEADKLERQRVASEKEQQRIEAFAALPPEVRQRVQERYRVSTLRMLNLIGMAAALGVSLSPNSTTEDWP